MAENRSTATATSTTGTAGPACVPAGAAPRNATPPSSAPPGATVQPGCVTPEEAAKIRSGQAQPLWVTPEEAARITAEKARQAKAAGAGAAQQQAKDGQRPNPAMEAVHRISADLAELKDYATFYLTTKVDGVKRTVRNIGLYAALGVVGAIVGGAMLATAAGMIIVGIGLGLGRLFGGHYWLGYIVTGLLILGAVGMTAWLMMNKLTNSWRSQTIAKYEQLKRTQRERYGRDVSDRARAEAAGRQPAAAK